MTEEKMTEEKLYSPVFVQMFDTESDWDSDAGFFLSQEDAVRYFDEIHAALKTEHRHIDDERGLMEYYGEDNSVDEKVHSLSVDVEIHDGKLWGVATLTRIAPLTTEEYDQLKEYLTGQYSDGFGEGFEQREIRVGETILFVSLWSSDSSFFVDTAQEFAARLGFLPNVPTQEPEAVQTYTLKAYIENPDRPQDGGFTMPLPATRETFAPFLENIGIKDIHNVKVGEVYSTHESDHNLSYWLNEALHDMKTPKSLEELNYLAAKIADMDEEQREIFGAALHAKWHVNSIGKMLNLAENLDCFDLQPAHSAAQYGDFVISIDQDSTCDVFTRLAQSSNRAERELAQYIERLEKCADSEAYGKLIADREGGTFTDYGYLRQATREVPEKYRGIQDIPAEHRISEGKETPAPAKQPVKVKVKRKEKPSLKATLERNRQKSLEQFGTAAPVTTKKKGDPER